VAFVANKNNSDRNYSKVHLSNRARCAISNGSNRLRIENRLSQSDFGTSSIMRHNLGGINLEE